MPSDDIKDVNAGKKHLYVYGDAIFFDNAGLTHHFCYAFQADLVKDGPAGSTSLTRVGAGQFICRNS